MFPSKNSSHSTFFPKQDSSLHIHASPSLSSFRSFSAPLKFQLLPENALFAWQVLLWFISRMLALRKKTSFFTLFASLFPSLSPSSFWLCLSLYVTEHASMILHLRYVLMYFLLRKFPTVADYAWTFRTNKHTNNALLRSSVLLAFEKKKKKHCKEGEYQVFWDLQHSWKAFQTQYTPFKSLGSVFFTFFSFIERNWYFK